MLDKKHKIKLISNESGDWEVLQCDVGFEQSGHSISKYEWIELFEYLGYSVETITISDEEMEMNF